MMVTKALTEKNIYVESTLNILRAIELAAQSLLYLKEYQDCLTLLGPIISLVEESGEVGLQELFNYPEFHSQSQINEVAG
jgi:hypothetical protein